jgi:threonine dehydrogenase-like Zn-dependent dehydrogenase
MKAVTFNVSLFRYLLTKAVGSLNRDFYYSRFSCTKLENVKEPELPGEDWVKVKTIYGGICGSDLGLVFLNDSPLLSPFGSDKFVIGHENVGTIVEIGKNVEGFEIGDRVVADDKLSCEPRGLDKCTNCKKGDYNLCLNFTEGKLAPGTMIGSCADTGGSWGEYYVVHKSRLFMVPENLKDTEAVLTDPLCSAIHPVLKDFPSDNERILVTGAGIIGLLVTAVLRAFGSKADITVIAKYDFQAELAEKYGANRVIRGLTPEKTAEITGGKVLKPLLGERYVMGGFDRVYDCVGSERTIIESVNRLNSKGKLVLVGLASKIKMDWTLVWFKEITVMGIYAYGNDFIKGKIRRTHDIALEMLSRKEIDVSPLVTHIFSLDDYRTAIKVASQKSKYKAVKVLLKP